MQNANYIKERNAVLVPLEDWEKIQRELIRLRKRVNKARVLADVKAGLVLLHSKGTKRKGARKFIDELLNEK